MRLGDGTGDGEPQPQASGAPRRAPIRLRKPFEDMRQKRGIDAGPGVLDLDDDTLLDALDAEDDPPAGRGELDGVDEEVRDGLLEPSGIADDRRQAGVDA